MAWKSFEKPHHRRNEAVKGSSKTVKTGEREKECWMMMGGEGGGIGGASPRSIIGLPPL